MLLDVILACAPLVAVAPVVVRLLTSQLTVAPVGLLQRRLYRSLLLMEKLPPGIVGARQITTDIDRQTLHVAYLAQYPHRGREVRDIALIGAGLTGFVCAYYLSLWAGAGWLYPLVFLALVAVGAWWLHRAVENFTRNDTLARRLFARFGAPEELIRPHTELVARAPSVTVDAALEWAADIRDAEHGASMTTLEAVNAALAAAHRHGGWRREWRLLRRRATDTDYRLLAESTTTKSLSLATRSYDWLLVHLLGPLFVVRLAFLDDRERHRTARATRRGDVFKAAWLPAHYRNERERLAGHWSHLHGAGEALSRFR